LISHDQEIGETNDFVAIFDYQYHTRKNDIQDFQIMGVFLGPVPHRQEATISWRTLTRKYCTSRLKSYLKPLISFTTVAQKVRQKYYDTYFGRNFAAVLLEIHDGFGDFDIDGVDHRLNVEWTLESLC
jgi:hypothetical protein